MSNRSQVKLPTLNEQFADALLQRILYLCLSLSFLSVMLVRLHLAVKKFSKEYTSRLFTEPRLASWVSMAQGRARCFALSQGEEKEYLGEVTHEKNIDVGYLPQEPQLDPDKTVRENIELGVAATRKLLTDFDAVNMRFGEELTDDEMNALLEEQGRLQDAIDAANAWELDHEIEQAMDALRVPDGDADVTKLSVGSVDVLPCVASCYRGLMFCFSMSPPTTSMSIVLHGLSIICANTKAPSWQ